MSACFAITRFASLNTPSAPVAFSSLRLTMTLALMQKVGSLHSQSACFARKWLVASASASRYIASISPAIHGGPQPRSIQRASTSLYIARISLALYSEHQPRSTLRATALLYIASISLPYICAACLALVYINLSIILILNTV